jgi:hypothetical protein
LPEYHSQVPRSDTLGTRTIVRFDPRAPRPTEPLLVGKYIVARKPMPGSVHTLYLIMDGHDVARSLISVPSEQDCADALRALEQRRRANSPEGRELRLIKRAKHAKAFRIKEAA